MAKSPPQRAPSKRIPPAGIRLIHAFRGLPPSALQLPVREPASIRQVLRKLPQAEMWASPGGRPIDTLRQNWSTFAGDSLGRMSQPVSYRNGIVRVVAKSGAVVTELGFAEERILTLLRDVEGFSTARAIRCVAG